MPDEINLNSTVQEVKEFLRAHFEKGTVCECCGQKVSAYKRTITASSAKILILLYTQFNNSFVHVQREFGKRGLLATGMDYIQLSRWGLIEPKTSEKNPEANDAGYWKITTTGIQFIKNQITIPKYAYIYNNKTYKWSIEVINIKEALGTKFNYEELFKI